MFGFGIFTSYIPYLVMAVLYMAYFLFSSFSGTKIEDKLSDAEGETGIFTDSKDIDGSRVLDDEKSYITQISDFSEDEQALIQLQQAPPVPHNVIFSTGLKERPAIISPRFSFDLFSRPPPVC